MDKCSLFFRGKLFAKAKVSKNTGEVYSEKGDVFDLVFSDVVMPGKLNGIGLIKEIRKFRPHQKFLLTSGYMGNQFKESDLNEISDIHVLKKPYKVSALEEYINKTMQGQDI